MVFPWFLDNGLSSWGLTDHHPDYWHITAYMVTGDVHAHNSTMCSMMQHSVNRASGTLHVEKSSAHLDSFSINEKSKHGIFGDTGTGGDDGHNIGSTHLAQYNITTADLIN